MSRISSRGWAGVCLLALALFVVVVSLLPEGPATLEALGGVLAQPVVVILLVVCVVGYVPWWLRRKE